MALLPDQTPISVAVFGEDPIVGRTLELLFRSTGYSARFLTQASFDKGDGLDGVQLLLFAGGLDAERREASMSFIKKALTKVGIPVLELTSSPEGAQARMGSFVPWPCRMEELKRRIEDALIDGSRPEEEKEESRD